jgi:aminoglycoside 6'-N-acetyltransferase
MPNKQTRSWKGRQYGEKAILLALRGTVSLSRTLIVANDLRVRTLGPDDVQDLCRWLSDPAVLEFYEGRDRPLDPETARRSYLSKQGAPVTGCVVEWHERPIGFAQFYPLDAAEKTALGYTPMEPVFGMDQFIGEPAYWNRGIGTRLVTAMVEYLRRVQGAGRVVVDPRTDNPRAIRCYEKSGFRKLRVLPDHELHEGRLRDCWLMECTSPDR